MPQSLYIEWADANGAFYRSRNYMAPLTLVGSPDPTAYLAALQALCNAGIQQHTANGVTTFDLTTPVVGTPYDTVYQVGQVSYTTVAPGGIRVLLPGLIKSNLLPDGIRIDPASLIALDTAVFALITDNLDQLATVRTSAVLTDRRTDQQ